MGAETVVNAALARPLQRHPRRVARQRFRDAALRERHGRAAGTRYGGCLLCREAEASLSGGNPRGTCGSKDRDLRGAAGQDMSSGEQEFRKPKSSRYRDMEDCPEAQICMAAGGWECNISSRHAGQDRCSSKLVSIDPISHKCPSWKLMFTQNSEASDGTCTKSLPSKLMCYSLRSFKTCPFLAP